ncbi:uncharacterized protein PV09_01461 [Verruconis gallopava]|uniref:Uncharacterized protein n=1 Tax=Verruconis gallopava TaxID=253628 RepID=A0A0D1XXL9_9PEZI|nr:uncharacterized protein PV09_01461 [Verruconis gallopava]KIW07496.1 hypothetical protein PV09_01461 [Verruconis gallopava]
MASEPSYDDEFVPAHRATSPRSLSTELAYETASRLSNINRSRAASPTTQYAIGAGAHNYPRSPSSNLNGSFGDSHDDFLVENQLDEDEPAYNPELDAPMQYDRRFASKISFPSAKFPANFSFEGRRLVIGVDFGTTYSGIAFATPPGETIGKLEEVHLMTNYGYAMNNDNKIPSVNSYSEPSLNKSRKERQFGRDLSPNAVAMVNSKLELDVQDTKLAELESLVHALEGMKNLSYANVKRCRGHPGFSWKSSEQIVTDYLAKVFKAFSEYLDRAYPGMGNALREEVPTELVITVPADWSPKAKNSTYRAVINAGFNQKNFRNMKKVFMVTEPEAAALYAIRWLKEDHIDVLTEDDSFVLCDAGGGTVDVVSYRVVSISPKLELEQIGHPTCKKCGSIYIDAKFKEWLRAHLGKHWRLLDPKSLKGRINAQMTEGQNMRSIMAEFEGFKKAFGSGQREVRFRLPEALKDFNSGNAIVAGEVIISQKQMKAFFDDCVDGVLSLVRDQVLQAELEGKRVTNIVMVGGFAESEYLQKEMKRSMGYRDITLHRPQESWTAVVRGAVITGVEHMGELKPLQSCPKNYGICLNEDFSGIHDNWDDRFLEESTSRVMALGQLHWLILKGDLLDHKEARSQVKNCPFTFSQTQSRKWKFEVYEWDHENPRVKLPKSYHNTRKELRTVLQIDVDMSSIPLEVMHKTHNNGRPYWTADTMCKMTYTINHVLEVQLVFRGKVVGAASRVMKEHLTEYERDDEAGDDDDDYSISD